MKQYWQIFVHSWGTIYCSGTERQAEQYRSNRAWTTGNVASKKLIERASIPYDEEIYELKDLLRRDSNAPRVFRAYPKDEE